MMQESPRRRSVSEKDFSECGRQGPAGETRSPVLIDLLGSSHRVSSKPTSLFSCLFFYTFFSEATQRGCTPVL